MKPTSWYLVDKLPSKHVCVHVVDKTTSMAYPVFQSYVNPHCKIRDLKYYVGHYGKFPIENEKHRPLTPAEINGCYFVHKKYLNDQNLLPNTPEKIDITVYPKKDHKCVKIEIPQLSDKYNDIRIATMQPLSEFNDREVCYLYLKPIVGDDHWYSITVSRGYDEDPHVIPLEISYGNKRWNSLDISKSIFSVKMYRPPADTEENIIDFERDEEDLKQLLFLARLPVDNFECKTTLAILNNSMNTFLKSHAPFFDNARSWKISTEVPDKDDPSGTKKKEVLLFPEYSIYENGLVTEKDPRSSSKEKRQTHCNLTFEYKFLNSSRFTYNDLQDLDEVQKYCQGMSLAEKEDVDDRADEITRMSLSEELEEQTSILVANQASTNKVSIDISTLLDTSNYHEYRNFNTEADQSYCDATNASHVPPEATGVWPTLPTTSAEPSPPTTKCDLAEILAEPTNGPHSEFIKNMAASLQTTDIVQELIANAIDRTDFIQEGIEEAISAPKIETGGQSQLENEADRKAFEDGRRENGWT